MANAKKCDRCGAYYTNSKAVTIHPVTAMDCDKSEKTVTITYDKFGRETALDLCPECVDELVRYFNDDLRE